MDKLSVFSEKLKSTVTVGKNVIGADIHYVPSGVALFAWSDGGWSNYSSDWLNNGWNNYSSDWMNSGWNNYSSDWRNDGWNNYSSDWSNDGWNNYGGGK